MTEETQVDRNACAAHGCPGLASMARGMPDKDSPWYCPIHASAEPDAWFHITAELNRLRWLVDVVRALRAGVTLTDEMKKSFALAQSCKDSMVQP